MNKILSFALIVFIIICAIVLAKGTSVNEFFSDLTNFIKRLFRNKPVINNNDGNRHSQGTIGLKEKSSILLSGRSAKEGIETQITVYDHNGAVIGTKTLYVDNDSLLIGRGKEKTGYNTKLCLPDICDRPTTSRTHCIIVKEDEKIFLKDCYDREEAFDDANQIHSVSNDYKTNTYVGSGFAIGCGETAEIDIGDYILKIKNLYHSSPRGVPTYGHKSVTSVPTKVAGIDASTKKYKFSK